MNVKKLFCVFVLVLAATCFASFPAMAEKPIKIGIIEGLSGPLEIYGKAEITGFKMGLEYFTNGTNKINGRPVELIVEDTQLKAARAKMLLTKLYSDDKVDLAVGPTSSGVALAVLPVAQQFKKSSLSNRPWPTPSPVPTGTVIFSGPAGIPARTPSAMPQRWPLRG